MLKSFFDLHLAEFLNPDELIATEVQQADLVQIRGQISGGVYHSQKMIWRQNLTGKHSVEEIFSSRRDKKAVADARQFFEQKGCEVSVTPLTAENYQKFLKLYQETSLQRERALTFDLQEQVEAKLAIGIPVYLIGVFAGEELWAGMIFSVAEVGKLEARVSFSAKRKFDEIRGGAGGVLLTELLQYCLSHNIYEVSDGRSTNPAGLTAKSGLFEFKARYGFTAYPDGPWLTTFIKHEHVALSDLVFVSIVNGELGYLVVSNQTAAEIGKRYTTQQIKNVQVVSFDQIFQQYQDLLRHLQA